MPITLTELFREEAPHLNGASRLNVSRRFTPIYRQGDPAEGIYFLTAGLVKLSNRGKDGKEVILRIAVPGEWFGEEGLAEGGSRETSAEVLVEGTLFAIPRAALAELAARRFEFWPLMAASLAGRVRAAERKIEMLCMEDVRARILNFVHGLAARLRPAGHTGDFAIPLSQSELAGLVGATRETTSTTLNLLARQGVLKLGRRMLVVPAQETAAAGAAEAELSATAQAGSRP